MSGTTPVFGWPYPTPSDARGAGADKIRDGLLAVEADLLESYAIAGSNGAPAVAANTTADLPMTLGGAGNGATADWAWDAVAGLVRYTGPTRWFMVHMRATFQADVTASSQVSFIAGLRLDAATITDTTDTLVMTSAAIQTYQFSRNLSTPVKMATNSGLGVRVQVGARASVACTGSLRIAAMGPKLS